MPGQRVSVVTPTLNQAAYIQRTIASVQAQTYGPVEHVVMDGGSADETLEILAREAEAGRLRYVTEGDRGMYDAINKGLTRTTGEVLAYLNSDDAWFPWAVETVMAVFDARPEVDLVFGDGIKVDDETGAQRLRLFAPFDRISLANYESICQPSVFWRRSLHDRLGGFDATLRYVADLDYWLRAAADGAVIVHVPEVLAIERIHAARLSSAHEAAMADEAGRMRARHAGEHGGPEGRKRAVQRDLRWQRRLWLRFMIAFALRPLGSSWRQFLRHGGVKVRGRRIVRAIRRYSYKWLWDAVSSSLAAATLGAETAGSQAATTPPTAARSVSHRLKLLVLATYLALRPSVRRPARPGPR